MKILPLLITSLLLSSLCFSQSLFQKLNGTETAFNFTSNQKTLLVTSQGIISKGVKESRKSNESDDRKESKGDSGWDGDGSWAEGYGYGYGHGYGYGYGYGFQAYHLEFIAKNKIKSITIPVNEVIPEYIEVQLLDKENRDILTLSSRNNSIIETIDNRGYSAYSININGVPITLLNETNSIDIRKVITRFMSEEELLEREEKRKKKLKLELEKNRLPSWIPIEHSPSIK